MSPAGRTNMRKLASGEITFAWFSEELFTAANFR